MKPLTVILLIVSVALVAACGESKQDKAKKTVCNAKSDISGQVKKLQGMTLSTATATDLKNSLTSIKDSLKQIADAQGDLSDARKAEVEKANQQFASEFQKIVSSVGSGTSISQAQSQLQSALGQLASAYQKSLARVNCS